MTAVGARNRRKATMKIRKKLNFTNILKKTFTNIAKIRNQKIQRSKDP